MSRQSSLVIVTSATRPKSPSFTSSSLFMPASSSNTWAAQHSTIYHHSIIDPGRQHCNLSAATAWLQSYTRVVPQVSFKMSSFFSFHIMKNPKGTYCSNTHPFNSLSSRTTRVSRYQNVKPISILLKQETLSGSGISWATCKSAPCSIQTTTPATHHSVFLQAGCPSCRPTNSVKALKGFARMPMHSI